MENEKLCELLKKISENDDLAFAELYNELSKFVYAVSLNILHDTYLAEDCVHDTFLHIKSSASRFEEGRNVKAWVYAIARNVSLTIYKTQKRVTPLDDEVLNSFSCDDFSQNSDTAVLVRNILNSLESRDREIILMHINEGMKFREISDILKIPLGTVLWRYNYILSKLKKKLSVEEVAK
jgi:RNA polymerase sigma-70 factor (ECF subfamily)